ncbi:11463_t:CDS:2, partial [Ambispora gerdemannii]
MSIEDLALTNLPRDYLELVMQTILREEYQAEKNVVDEIKCIINEYENILDDGYTTPVENPTKKWK